MAYAINTSRNIFAFYKTWFKQQRALFEFIVNRICNRVPDSYTDRGSNWQSGRTAAIEFAGSIIGGILSRW